MILAVHPAGRAARWDGTNAAELEELCGGRTTRAHLFDETGIVVDAWGDAQCAAHGDWVIVTRRGGIEVLSQSQFAKRYRIVPTKGTARKAAA